MQSNVSETQEGVSAVVVEGSQPVADQELILTPEEAVALLEKEEKPTLEFLNKLSAAIYHTEPRRQANPGLPQQLIDKLMQCYDAASWEENVRPRFSDALAFPLRVVFQVNLIFSVPALLALFEQFSLSDTRKKMFFLQTPAETVRNYAITMPSHLREITIRNAANTSALFTLDDWKKPTSELSKKAIPFIQSCGTLARKMNKDQSGELLRLLINDKTLHQRIPDLIWHPETTDDVLDGYIQPYMEVMLDPNADPELKKILSPFGGVLMERMSREQFFELLRFLYVSANCDALAALLMRSRESKKLKSEIIEVLVHYFAELSQVDSALHMALFPAAFTRLCGQIVPAMSDEQCQTVLSDPFVEIDVYMIQALNKFGPIALSSECMGILVIRSAMECRPALDHLIKVFEDQNKVSCIVSMFTEYVKDPEYGHKLRAILLKDYFPRFLNHLVSRGVSITDLLESVLDTSGNDLQLEGVILALVEGCKKKESASQYAVVTKQLFANPKLHHRLFELKGTVRLFTGVVDSFIELDHETLKPIFDFIFEKGDLKEPLLQLLTVFTGRRVALLKTNDMNQNTTNGCFHEKNLTYLLQRAATIPVYKEDILRDGSLFIIHSCRVDSPKAAAVLKLYLDFGCRPSPKDCEGEDAVTSTDNPFHIAAIHRNIPMLSLLLPHLKRVGKVMLGLMIYVERYSINFNKEAFELVFKAALEKEPTCIYKAEFISLYTRFSFPSDAKHARPRLEAALMMIEAGIVPTIQSLGVLCPALVKQEAKFIEQFSNALRKNTLRDYLSYLVITFQTQPELIPVFNIPQLLQTILAEQKKELDHSTLVYLRALAEKSNQPQEFLDQLSNLMDEARNRAVTASPVFFGGSNEAARTVAPVKRAKMGAAPPVKAAAQPSVTTALFFGGDTNVVPRTHAPVKRAMLGARASAEAPTTLKKDDTLSKYGTGFK